MKNKINIGLVNLIETKFKTKASFLLGFIVMTVLFSCEDFVEIDAPRNEIVRATAISDDEAAVAVISGIYTKMQSGRPFTKGEIDRYLGIYADELIPVSNSVDDLEFAASNLLVTNGTSGGIFWNNTFELMLNVNSLIEGLVGNQNVTGETSKQVMGEAKFLRAFFHFYLTNLFGATPIVTTSDVQTNNTISRSPAQEVYQQIITDLLEAKDLMLDDFDFVNAQSERIRPNKHAAIALLARTYLYMEDWQKAEEYATQLINNGMFGLEMDLNNVFLATSNEAIWQLQPVLPPYYTVPQAISFILRGAPSIGSTQSFFRDEFKDNFEMGDQRLDNWVGIVSDSGVDYYFSYKYKDRDQPARDEYSMVFRLAEQYLIRAEARAQQNNIGGARADINTIRNRAGLLGTAANTQASLLTAIEQERQVELFTEWGHRWFDIKRTGRADAVLSPIKPDWRPTNILFPVPENEIGNNPNLLPQNEGY